MILLARSDERSLSAAGSLQDQGKRWHSRGEHGSVFPAVHPDSNLVVPQSEPCLNKYKLAILFVNIRILQWLNHIHFYVEKVLKIADRAVLLYRIFFSRDFHS